MKKLITEKNGNLLILLLSFFTVVGSLYISEILKIQPCSKCWWIRVGMFPMLVISGYTFVTKKYEILNMLYIFSGFSLLVSSYYWYMTQFATSSLMCAPGTVSCVDAAVPIIGFVNLPFMGMITSIAIIVIVFIMRKIAK